MKTILATLLLLATAAASAADFYVAPAGDDANPGSADKPFATLRRARDAIRALKALRPLAEAVRVIVADGTYQLREPLVLEPLDSGTAAAPVAYQAAPDAHPVFSGGRVLRGWQPGEKGLWKLHIPEVAAGHWYFEQLFVNAQRATRARSPNKFYYYLQDVRETRLGPTGKVPAARARQTVRMRQEDFAQTLSKVRPEELRDVNLVVYHNWDNTRRFLDGVDAAQAALQTTGQGMKPWNPWQRNAHFILENWLGALDAPGEWFLSRAGTLYYKPLPGEDMTRAEVVAPVTEKFLVIAGDPSAGKFVEYVTFRGLGFQHGQWLTPRGGFEPAQAAAPIEAVVMLDGARRVFIEDCEIAHVGTYAVWFRRGCHDCALRHSYLYDFGAGGVRVGETGIAGREAEQTGHIQLDNNIIRHGGRIFPCAVGVWIGQSGGNLVTHNEIADLYYTGISTGWCWGYGKNLAKNNTFAFNHVHHLGWGLLSDMGGIYTLGPSEGTVVRNNVFHDVYAYSYGGWGMYTDEGSSGILFENNLVYRTKTGGFHQHYGRENVLRNNILALSKQQQIQATRVEPHLSFTLDRNIVYWDTGKLLAGPWEKLNFASHNNVYWNATGEAVEFVGHSLAAWQAKGHEQGSQIADPKFANPARADFRLAADSPAVKLGFQPFDSREAGVYGDPTWVRLADGVTYPPLEIAPSPPPLEIDDDFEEQPVGAPPAGARVHVEHRGDAIVVTDEIAASGKRCVKFVDAPGLKQVFNPHLTYENLGYERGLVRSAFDLRIERDSLIQIEWRDYSDGDYRIGPQLAIRNATLRLGKTAVLPLPVREWIHFEILRDLSATAADGWALQLSWPGQSAREFPHLPLASAGFKKLTWIGFMSNATTKTTFYLDNFRLSPGRGR